MSATQRPTSLKIQRSPPVSLSRVSDTAGQGHSTQRYLCLQIQRPNKAGDQASSRHDYSHRLAYSSHQYVREHFASYKTPLREYRDMVPILYTTNTQQNARYY